MEATQVRLLDEVRGSVAARALIDNALEQRVVEFVAAELDRSTLAYLLGIDRCRSTADTSRSRRLLMARRYVPPYVRRYWVLPPPMTCSA